MHVYSRYRGRIIINSYHTGWFKPTSGVNTIASFPAKSVKHDLLREVGSSINHSTTQITLAIMWAVGELLVGSFFALLHGCNYHLHVSSIEKKRNKAFFSKKDISYNIPRKTIAISDEKKGFSVFDVSYQKRGLPSSLPPPINFRDTTAISAAIFGNGKRNVVFFFFSACINVCHTFAQKTIKFFQIFKKSNFGKERDLFGGGGEWKDGKGGSIHMQAGYTSQEREQKI